MRAKVQNNKRDVDLHENIQNLRGSFWRAPKLLEKIQNEICVD